MPYTLGRPTMNKDNDLEQGAGKITTAQLIAGREFDALVAKVVFGAKNHRLAYEHRDRKKQENPRQVFDVAERDYRSILRGEYGQLYEADGTPIARGRAGYAPHSSSTIEAAFLVVAAMREKGYSVAIHTLDDMKPSVWQATFRGPRSGTQRLAPSLPLAICMAAVDELSRLDAPSNTD